MATTSIKTGNVWNVLTLDADHLLKRMKIVSITFAGGTTADYCNIKDGSEDGAVIFHELSVAGESRTVNFDGAAFTPFFDVSASDITSGLIIIITKP